MISLEVEKVVWCVVFYEFIIDVVYAFPNSASISPPLNHFELRGRIALVDRGQVSKLQWKTL